MKTGACIGTFLIIAILRAAPIFSSEQDPQRTLRYTTRPAKEASQWQKDLRSRLVILLRIDDLLSGKEAIPSATTVLSREEMGTYQKQEIEFQSTQGRRIRALITIPHSKDKKLPAVVCIHGHGHERSAVYDPTKIYKGFASELAQRGAVTIAVNVGQHQVYEEGRSLMGERLWDLMRCVDVLESMPEVDTSRIGCAGLSLGGEMAMWLGAMDERVSATLSSGFLTRMDQMEENHCQCWKFDGLRHLVDWAEVYSLIAPRALLCQNGLKEPPTDFTVPLAQESMAEIQLIYKDLGAEDKVNLVAHPEGHVIDLPSLLDFFERTLGIRAA